MLFSRKNTRILMDDFDKIPIVSLSVSPDDLARRASLLSFLKTALEMLPQKQADILAFYYLEGLSACAIADRLGIHKSTVYRRLHKALENMKKMGRFYIDEDTSDR